MNNVKLELAFFYKITNLCQHTQVVKLIINSFVSLVFSINFHRSKTRIEAVAECHFRFWKWMFCCIFCECLFAFCLLHFNRMSELDASLCNRVVSEKLLHQLLASESRPWFVRSLVLLPIKARILSTLQRIKAIEKKNAGERQGDNGQKKKTKRGAFHQHRRRADHAADRAYNSIERFHRNW